MKHAFKQTLRQKLTGLYYDDLLALAWTAFCFLAPLIYAAGRIKTFLTKRKGK